LAIVVGASVGAPRDPALRFAVRDALRVAETLRDVAEVPRQDIALLLDSDAAQLRAAIAAARGRAGANTVLFFYYSGHAGADGLHLGADVVAWDELRALADAREVGLRLLFVDACNAGALARPKGFTVKPAPALPPEAARGSAVLAAAEWFEPAQESDSVRGSFFTDALISGLRGAADADGDQRVTLTELQGYTGRDVAARTAGDDAGSLQHPTYRFEVAGRGDIVLGHLRDADARVRLGSGVAGHVVVLERDSTYVVVDTEKRIGNELVFALPRGRYVVHVRARRSVGVADVTLPWGGEVIVQPTDLSPRSYQEFALKGEVMDVRRYQLRAGLALDTPPLPGMGPLLLGLLSGGRKIGVVALSLEAGAGRRGFSTFDTQVTATVIELAAVAALERPVGVWDLRIWGGVQDARIWQEIAGAMNRVGWVPGAAVGASARLPLGSRTFLDGGLSGRVTAPNLESVGRVARLGLRGEIWAGWTL
jgi:hypothetical protein